MDTQTNSPYCNIFDLQVFSSCPVLSFACMASRHKNTTLTANRSYVYTFMLKAFLNQGRGHGGRVVTLSPPTSEAGVWFPARPQVGKLVVACRWSAV